MCTAELQQEIAVYSNILHQHLAGTKAQSSTPPSHLSPNTVWMFVFVKKNTHGGMKKGAVTCYVLHMNWIMGLTSSFPLLFPDLERDLPLPVKQLPGCFCCLRVLCLDFFHSVWWLGMTKHCRHGNKTRLTKAEKLPKFQETSNKHGLKRHIKTILISEPFRKTVFLVYNKITRLSSQLVGTTVMLSVLIKEVKDLHQKT